MSNGNLGMTSQELIGTAKSVLASNPCDFGSLCFLVANLCISNISEECSSEDVLGETVGEVQGILETDPELVEACKNMLVSS